jgi:phage recombination protein Bet
MSALALREDQSYWDKGQLAVLESSGIDQDVTEAELTAFLHECLRRKLDPFTRQIYLIGRYDNRKGRKVYRSQTSIDGFRLIARRAADKSGIDYSYEDTIWFDAEGKRHEIWLSDQPPAGAKVVVIRNGCRFDAVARLGAYVQLDRNGNTTGQWRTMADVMIAKCAEALALRKAFPEDLGGIYTEEEMAQADNPQRVQATAETVRVDRPEPEAVTDEEWLGEALGRTATLADKEACTVLWHESAAMVRDGKCTKADAVRVQELIKARLDELAEAVPQEQTAGPASAALDPEDPWAAKVESLSDDEEAAEALAELVTMCKAHEMDMTRANQVRDAILERFPAAAEVRAAA